MRHVALLPAAALVAWVASFVVAPAGDVMMRFYCWSLVMVAILAAYSAGRKVERRAAAATSASSNAARLAFWQFSLREMILGVVIVSLAMVIATRSRPFTTTPVFDSLDHNPLHAITRQINVTLIPNGHGFVSAEDSRATWMDEDNIDASDRPDIRGQPRQIVAALYSEMIGRLRHAGCRISRDWQSHDEFDVRYQLGVTAGQIRAYSFPVSAGNWKLRMFVDESRTE